MDTIKQAMIDTTSATVQNTSEGIDVWMIIAIVELVVIIGLLLSPTFKRNQKAELKRKILAEGGDVDFANLMNSSFNSEKLYKELIVKCHPDRFAPDESRMSIANELSTQITKNKHDIKRLEALREEEIFKLNINI